MLNSDASTRKELLNYWIPKPTTPSDVRAVSVVWIPPATKATARVYTRHCAQVQITGNLVPEAQLAALAVEHGVEITSADTDFMRFSGLRWTNPLNPV